METATAYQCLYYTKINKQPKCSYASSYYTATSLIPQSIGFQGLKAANYVDIRPCRHLRGRVGVVLASSDAGKAPANVSQGWLLEPVGDGDWKHIGQKVAMPGAYEVFSSEMTVGRVPEKADLVIPVATVSGVHARIQNKQGSLLVTDLDSTNGTYINEKRVPPGATAPVPPGSLLTFGDTHLAIFRVSRLEKSQEAEEPTESEKPQSEDTQETTP